MADNLMKLKIVSPDRVFYEGKVQKVEFNTSLGEIGVLPKHIPLTVIIEPGLLSLYSEKETKQAALHAGFAEILPEAVTILAEVIEWPEEIDISRAEAAAKRAKERIGTKTPETDMTRAETALHRAMVRLSAAGR